MGRKEMLTYIFLNIKPYDYNTSPNNLSIKKYPDALFMSAYMYQFY